MFLGDIVLGQSAADGTVSDVRITSLRGEKDNDNGHVRWYAIAEPYEAVGS